MSTQNKGDQSLVRETIFVRLTVDNMLKNRISGSCRHDYCYSQNRAICDGHNYVILLWYLCAYYPIVPCKQYPIALVSISGFKWHMLSEHVHTQCSIVHPRTISHCTPAFNISLFSWIYRVLNDTCYPNMFIHHVPLCTRVQYPIVHPRSISHCSREYIGF